MPRSYYVKRFNEILKPIVIAAVFVNVFLFFFGLYVDLPDIQILAILNTIFLSFALLQEEKS